MDLEECYEIIRTGILQKTTDSYLIKDVVKILDQPENLDNYLLSRIPQMICKNSITPASVLLRIFNDENLSVFTKEKVLTHENFPSAVAQEIVMDENYPEMFKREAIQNPNLSEEFLIHIIQNFKIEDVKNTKGIHLLNYLCMNPNFSNNIFKEIIEFEKKMKIGKSDSINEYYGICLAICRTKDINMIQAAVVNNVCFRYVAINQITTTELLRKVFSECLDDSIENNDVLYYISQHKNTDAKILNELKHNKDYRIRAEVALNKNASIETLKFLSKDTKSSVRKNVAKNKNTSSSILNILKDTDKSKAVRENAKKNLGI